jgi:glycosyltransferase involved in cell wall biosynthesis
VLAGAPFARFAGRARLAGFVGDDELAALYRGALAVVVPSLDEGFGLPAAEAMASGVPVITSTAPALVEVTGDAALHADERSTRAIAAAMLRVSADAELRRTLSARGIERARAFTWRRCAELTRDAFRAAAKTR